jgi:hypothetical protein
VRDVRPGGFGSAPAALTDVNGRVFFTVYEGVLGVSWVSDGTSFVGYDLLEATTRPLGLRGLRAVAAIP